MAVDEVVDRCKVSFMDVVMVMCAVEKGAHKKSE
jgi:hypothetical protein